jgi:hypothetical protein
MGSCTAWLIAPDAQNGDRSDGHQATRMIASGATFRRMKIDPAAMTAEPGIVRIQA